MAKKATSEKSEHERSEGEAPLKRCLMITPIGQVDSEIRRATDGLFEEVVEPVCAKLGYAADVSHKMNEPGSIMDQVVGRLIDDELVIANLTLSNPNVMYELAVRHAAKKPVICLLHEGHTLPFDLLIERVIPYRNDMKGVGDLRRDLEKTIGVVEAAGDTVDNPVVRGAKRFRLTSEDVPQTEFQAIMRRLDVIEARISTAAHVERAEPLQAAAAPAFRLYFNVTGTAEAVRGFQAQVGDFFESSRFAPLSEAEGQLTMRGSVYERHRSVDTVRFFLTNLANDWAVLLEYLR